MKFKEIVLFLNKENSNIGMLCRYLLNDNKFNFDWNDEAIYIYLNNLIVTKGNEFDEPVRRIKTIYQTIKRAK